MRIEYRRTFSQFVDNYLATYYAAGVQTLRRMAGGPFLIFVGVIVINFAIQGEMITLFRVLLWGIGLAISIYGLAYGLRPMINIFLVWLRKDKFLGEEGALVTLEIQSEEELIIVGDPDGEFEIHFDAISTIQHRADSAWILTTTDNMISIPREGLLTGNLDEFISTIERILDEKEQQH